MDKCSADNLVATKGFCEFELVDKEGKFLIYKN